MHESVKWLMLWIVGEKNSGRGKETAELNKWECRDTNWWGQEGCEIF